VCVAWAAFASRQLLADRRLLLTLLLLASTVVSRVVLVFFQLLYVRQSPTDVDFGHFWIRFLYRPQSHFVAAKPDCMGAQGRSQKFCLRRYNICRCGVRWPFWRYCYPWDVYLAWFEGCWCTSSFIDTPLSKQSFVHCFHFMLQSTTFIGSNTICVLHSTNSCLLLYYTLKCCALSVLFCWPVSCFPELLCARPHPESEL